jgi:hypothetical protein
MVLYIKYFFLKFIFIILNSGNANGAFCLKTADCLSGMCANIRCVTGTSS